MKRYNKSGISAIVIGITMCLSISTFYNTFASGILDYREYKFKENKVKDTEVFNGIKTEPPSLSNLANRYIRQSQPTGLPQIAYNSKDKIDFEDVTITTTKTNPSLKDSNIKYNSDLSTSDLVYTGYTFSNGLQFPIDLRENRALGISNGVKPKNKGSIVVTSSMGFRGRAYHNGIDIAGGVGENGIPQQHNYYAPIDCTVIVNRTTPTYGNLIGIQFTLNDEYIYRMYFAHMKSKGNQIVLKEGNTIKQGTYLGKMGSTGQVTGSHLHWEAVRLNASSSDKVSVYPSLINTSGGSSPYKWSLFKGKIKCILKPEYKEAGAISFDPTRLYGNLGNGTFYRNWWSKLKIGFTSDASNEKANDKIPFIQSTNATNSQPTTPWPLPQDYDL